MNRQSHTPRNLAIALAAGLLFATPVFAAKTAKTASKSAAPYATVNGVAVSAALAEAFLAEQTAQGVPDSKELRDAIREELIRREIMAQEAKKMGLDKKPETMAHMDTARQAILIRAFIQNHLKANPITDADVQSEYDRIKGMAANEKEYKARHILVETEDQAKAIIEKLGKGEKFEILAKESKDVGSMVKGGDLGWSGPAAYVKPFGEALTKLEKGKYTTTPVKSDFGYHVIMLEDTRAAQFPPLEQAKPQLQQRLQQQRVEKIVSDLRAKAKVE